MNEQPRWDSFAALARASEERRPLSAAEAARCADELCAAPRDVAARGAELRAHDPTGELSATLLAELARRGTPAALEAFAELACAAPPHVARHADAAFSPLFRRGASGNSRLFPRLLALLEEPALAGLVLDLANHLHQSGQSPEHPALAWADRLTGLLGEAAQALALIEEQPSRAGASAGEISDRVGQGVALAVSACHALRLCEHRPAIGKLRQALALRHRRVRAEAAAALAALGEEEGASALVELAAQPAARGRALAFLEELGLLDRVPAEHRAPLARAEADLTSWLAFPQQFGLPPQRTSLIEQRRLRWPGDDAPAEWFLFRFDYDLPGLQYSGCGVAGPLVQALFLDLLELSADELFSLYAGWSAEHPELTARPPEDLPAGERAAAEKKLREAALAGYEDLRLALVAGFFGETQLVAHARRAAEDGFLVLDANGPQWRPAGRGPRPLGALEIHWLHRGRRLLREFNPGVFT